MFKKEKNGKTNINRLKGGEYIGFSFYIFNSNIIVNILKNKNRNRKSKIHVTKATKTYKQKL